MALDAATAQELIRQLTADRNQYLENVNRTTDLLIKAIAASGGIINHSPPPRIPQLLTADTLRRNTIAGIEVESVNHTNSVFTGDDESSVDDGESLFVDRPLKPDSYTVTGLREHIRNHKWSTAGRQILRDIIGNEHVLQRPTLFPTSVGSSDDRSHLCHDSIYEVGEDGIAFQPQINTGGISKSIEIWNRLRSINSNPEHSGKSVGQIICVREPSPLLFAALHYTLLKHFDMDELFGFLLDKDPVLVRPHNPFDDDMRKKRSFVFNMEYFTLIGRHQSMLDIPYTWQSINPRPYLELTMIRRWLRTDALAEV